MLKAGYVNNVVSLPESTSPIVVKRTAFSNKGFAFTELKGQPAIIGVSNNAFGTVEKTVAAEVQVGRYTTVATIPTEAQVRLLSAIVRVEFPGSMTRVGQAVEHLLQPSGYRLSPQHVAEPTRQSLLNLPLPEPHRTLGPMPLRMALETLAGPSFRLVEDPVHRLVSFERCTPDRYMRPGSSDAMVR